MKRVKLSVDHEIIQEDLKDFYTLLNHKELQNKRIIKVENMLGEEMRLLDMPDVLHYEIILPIVFADIDTSFYVYYEER